MKLDTPLGKVIRGRGGSYRLEFLGRLVAWIPFHERALQVYLPVCAHMQDAGSRAVQAMTDPPHRPGHTVRERAWRRTWRDSSGSIFTVRIQGLAF